MSRTGGEARRAALLAEAMRAFGSRGFDGTTLDEVAEAAGVRKQSLLYYFPSKDALFDACVEEFCRTVGAALEGALVDQLEGWDRVEGVLRSLFRLADSNPELFPFAREAARKSPEVTARIAEQLEPLRARALEFLEREMAAGTFRKQDPRLLLFTLYTAAVGSFTEAGVLRVVAGADSQRAALRRREDQLVDFVRHALQP